MASYWTAFLCAKILMAHSVLESNVPFSTIYLRVCAWTGTGVWSCAGMQLAVIAGVLAAGSIMCRSDARGKQPHFSYMLASAVLFSVH